jgi:dTDP-glucose 4,6-dehydratase
MKRALLTGAAGFAGSHIVDHILQTTDWEIVGLDRLSYAGSLDRLKEHRGNPRLNFVFHDFRAVFPTSLLKRIGKIHYVIHNGAETHVDRSLLLPGDFIESNVVGTFHVLEAARRIGVERFIFTSTDEVFGPAPPGVSYEEDDPIKPSNPYSATKAAGEALCYSYFKSYGLPVVTTRTMNMFGEKQHPEKFVPLVMKKVLDGERVPIHAAKYEGVVAVCGSRNWLHARNQADAILFLLEHGRDGQTYHVAGIEKSNSDIAELVAQFVGADLRKVFVDAVTHRRGHDLRYALADDKIRSLGWKPPVEFLPSLEKTVLWTLAHKEWLHE